MGNKTNLRSLLTVSVFLAGFGCATAAGRTIYVDANAPPGGNGSSWPAAFKYLQDALAAAAGGDGIWVAAGSYKPAGPGGSRTATFQLKNGVGLYGGFPAGGGTWAERNPSDPNNETILSGDLNGDDGLAYGNWRENSYHVVTGSGTDGTAIVDGFTIIAGNANSGDAGGGMINKNYSGPTVSNCNFKRNCYYGMYNYNNSNPTVTNCTFNGTGAIWSHLMKNYASSPIVTGCTFGGHQGMGNNNNSNPTVTGCTFIDNGYYGGMENSNNSSPTVTNCTFSGNASGNGGGMDNSNNSHPIVTNCTFSGNYAGESGGGLFNYWDSSATLTNCTFIGNEAGQYGGGIANDDNCSATLTNCILWANYAYNGPQIALSRWPLMHGGGTANVSYCDVQGGQAAVYDPCEWLVWGAGNIDSDPLFVDPGHRKGYYWVHGDYHLLAQSPCIDAGDNTAVPAGLTTDLDGRPRFLDDLCTIDTGNGTPPIVDMGAYEFAYIYFGDFDGDCKLDVNFKDFAIFALAWLTEPGKAGWNPACDVSAPADNSIDWRDLAVLVKYWLIGVSY